MRFSLPEPNQAFDIPMDDGASIAVRRHGNPDGVRLIVSHGNGFAINGYLPFWGPLQDDFDLVVFDMRNHGENPRSGGDGHNYLQFSHDLERVYQGVTGTLGHKTSIGVFHSMSARTAMKHAVEIGWRWDALVLFDPPSVPPVDHWHYEAMRVFEKRLLDWAMDRPTRFADPADLAGEYAENRGHSRWVPGAHQLMAEAILRKEDDKGDWALVCRRELEAAIYLEALTLDLWPTADAFGGPTILIGADPEMKGAPPTGRANRALHEENGIAYEAIPGTGHLLQLEQPDACRAAMLRFLKDHSLIDKT